MAAPTYLSLFAGGGGLDLAIKIALPKARCLGYVEIEATAAEILVARIAEGSTDDAPVWTDVRTIPCELYRDRVAGVCGGFPCPDYSVAGRRAGIVGKHGQLWNAMRETIREVRPEWVYLENVPGILVPHAYPRWRRDSERQKWAQYRLPAGLAFVLGDLAEMGFDAVWGCIPAAAVGASHKRERWFCLAYRQGRGCRELWESSWGRRFAECGSEDVGHAGCQPEQLQQRQIRPEFARAGVAVASSDDAQWRQNDERGGCGGEGQNSEGEAHCGVGESGDVLGDTDSQRNDWSRHAGARRRRESANHGGELADASGAGLPHAERETGHRATWDGEGAAVAEFCGRLELFAPGPSFAEWQDLLVRCPWLRPAIAQAEIESHLRGVADGLADMVVRERADAIRAAGNGVVAMQGAAMLLELIRRARW